MSHGIDAYDLAARFNYAGLQVGAAYWDAGETGAAMGTDQDFTGWSVNAIYTFGPLGVELQYASAEKSTASMGADNKMTTATNTFDARAISVGYSVAPGLKWYGELVGVEFDNPGDKNDNEALVAISGLMLSF